MRMRILARFESGNLGMRIGFDMVLTSPLVVFPDPVVGFPSRPLKAVFPVGEDLQSFAV